jgi:hypothetical protein
MPVTLARQAQGGERSLLPRPGCEGLGGFAPPSFPGDTIVSGYDTDGNYDVEPADHSE